MAQSQADAGKIATSITKKAAEAATTAAQGQPAEAAGKIAMDIAKKAGERIAGQASGASQAQGLGK